MYDDSNIKDPSLLKRWYRKFDRLNPFVVGFLSYIALSLIYSVLPYGMQDIGYGSTLNAAEIISLMLLIGAFIIIPPLMFLKGAIQNRELVLCILGLIAMSFINLFNIGRLIRLLEALLAVL